MFLEHFSQQEQSLFLKMFFDFLFLGIFTWMRSRDTSWYLRTIDSIFILLNKAEIAICVIRFANMRIDFSKFADVSSGGALIAVGIVLFGMALYAIYCHFGVFIIAIAMVLRYKYLNDEDFNYFINKHAFKNKKFKNHFLNSLEVQENPPKE